MLHYILKHILWWKDRRLGHRRLSLGSTTQLSEGKTPQVSNQNYRLRHRNPSSLDQHACPPPLQEQIVQNAPYVVLVGCNHPRQANKQLYIELSWQHWSESCSFFVIFWCLASLATRSLTLHLWWIHKPLLIALILWVFLWFFVAVFSLSVQFSSVQFSSVSRVRLFATPWIAACQASLSITNSHSLLKLMPIESVMLFSHLILCHPLLLLPPISPSIRVFSSESALHMRWPKYSSFSFSISPSSEHPGLISFRMDWLDLLAVQETLKRLLQTFSL